MYAAKKRCTKDCRFAIGYPSEYPRFWDIHSFDAYLKHSKLNQDLKKKNSIPNISFRYSSEDAVGDLVAGITVGLTVIPQALAYAGIAGLDPAVSITTIKFIKQMNALE